MKKILLALLVSTFAFVNISFWEYSYHNRPEYNPVVEDASLNFKIDTDGPKLKITWNAYTEDDFKWYKIVKSATNKKPSYPEDNTLKVIVDKEVDTEIAYDVVRWAYYRLCVIKQNNDRTCSNVVYLDRYTNPSDKINDRKKEKKEYLKKKRKELRKKQEKLKKHYSTLDRKLDIILNKFFKKVEEKYKTTQERVEKLEQTKKALEKLADKNKRYATMVKRLILKISKKIEEYDNGLEEIKKILDM